MAGLVSVLALAGGAGRAAPGALNLPARTDPAGWTLVEALPGLTFSEPVAAVSPPGETNRLYVAERTGLVWAVSNLAAPDKTLAADLRAGLDLSFIEQGLLGLAFHPGFATNGQVFFTRNARTVTATETQNSVQLLRYVIPPGAAAVDPASQTIIFAQPDFSNTHNGGDLAFGPDGYLYVSCGDELPAAKDITANRQPLDAGFFGGILRIDVDLRPGNLPPNPHPAASAHYLVPADNPFVGLTEYQGVPYDPARVCTEFWAVGFRNPWRMAFDAPTGRLFVGDVGGSRVEEINLVERGGNYGWPYLEGDLPYQSN
ncbi:MAG TPA: PQQ-dependent sugar dehydrogenase, partial [Verrucomicrobiota bacterium]|nr:PQQ-dependent sugar dehydrogenase [Verrucomicrobiota bacterium]